ncbi:MAG TPA: hypothetical protein VFX17_02035 [Patescibacteria group bacterium]|nr:hypothetical protein [Patescibacteria group bacterium]
MGWIINWKFMILKNFKMTAVGVLCASLVIFAFPVFTDADGLGASNQGNILGEPCLVRVFNTDFAFPQEGGEIVQTANSNMYFVRTYLPGCENAGSAGTVIVGPGPMAPAPEPTPIPCDN